MKKIMVVMLAVLMTACGSPSVDRSNSYISKGLGISFQFAEGYSVDCKNIVEEDDHSITSPAVNDKGCFGGAISVFEKQEDQSIEDAILNLIKEAGKDPANCKIVKGSNNNNNNNGNTEYGINLADNYVFEFTDKELKQISEADKQSALDKGPFDGEWEKGNITAEKTMAICSPIDGPSYYMGTSKTIPNLFWYNESKSKTKFVYTQGSADPTFYEWASVEAL